MNDDPDDVPPRGAYVQDARRPMSRAQTLSSLAAVLLLVLAGMFTLRGFLPALAWAVIFAIALWPTFDRASRRLPRHRRGLLPFGLTLIVLLGFVIPVIMIATPLISDAHDVGQWLIRVKTNGIAPPPFLGSLPFGDRILPLWRRELSDPAELSLLVGHGFHGVALHTGQVIGLGALRLLVLLAVMLLALFFLLRDGEAVAAELKVAIRRTFGPSGEDVAAQVVLSIHGTVNGLVFVGLGEGAVLGVAYGLAGVPHPALFGLITAVLAMVPFGAPVVFLLAAGLLLASSKVVAAVAIIGVGFFTTFVADHFVRPALIGGATRLPFIWVLLGIVGGVEAWGLVGLFLGPAILAALMLLWREWVGSKQGPLNPSSNDANPRVRFTSVEPQHQTPR